MSTSRQFASAIAGPSRLSIRHASSSSTPYPFSSTALVQPAPSTTPTPALLHPKNGAHLITHLNASQRPPSVDPSLFSRRAPNRLRPGSVLTVLSYAGPTRTNTTAFSGVLMGIRRRGVDTSFRLRNVVNKLGVEVSYKVHSPMIKEVKVIKRAEGRKGEQGTLRDLGRAKVNYLRERPSVMAQIASTLKAAKQ